MHILITGGAGFIGSHLALALQKRGHSVCVVDNFSEQIHGKDRTQSFTYKQIKGSVDIIEGDVCDPAPWIDALRSADVVVHLAAETGTGQSMYCVGNYMNTNTLGTARLIDAISLHAPSVRKVILASSRAVYGEGKYDCRRCGVFYPESRKSSDLTAGKFDIFCPVCGSEAAPVPTDESSAIHPVSVYGLSKEFQERLLSTIGILPKVDKIILRFQNVYGPGQSLHNPYTGLFSVFSTRIRNGNDIDVFEDGNESRDFIYVDDTVMAIINSIETKTSPLSIYNVGNGTMTRVTDVANLLKSILESAVAINVSGHFRLVDIRHNFADISRAARDLNFTPEVDFKTGVTRYVQWVLQQEIHPDRSEAAIAELTQRGLYK